MLGKILLKNGLQQLDLRGSETLHNIQYSEFGRPYLPQQSIDFNISHSGNMVACALATDCEVGIDVEQIRTIDLSNFRSQLTAKEWIEIHQTVNPIEAFFSLWTQKEAALKVEGSGLNIPLQEVRVNKDLVSIRGKTWYTYKIAIASTHICHLAASLRIGNHNVKAQHFIF